MTTEMVSLKALDEGDVDKKMSFKERKKVKQEMAQTFPAKAKYPKGKSVDPYPEKLPIADSSLARHGAGIEEMDPTKMRSYFSQKRMVAQKEKFMKRVEVTARAELLNQEESGWMETDDGTLTATITQREIVESADLASASKHFDLHLEQFGPYHIDYTDNGRHLLLGGRRGHIASMDWQTKKLHNENNVMETVRDVKYLHTEQMYAVSQKHYTYIYDQMGTELHCLKKLPEVLQLEFLPKHFLLVAGSKNSWLHWLDVSVGEMVQSFVTRSGPINVMCQNPSNGIIHTGAGDGTVSLWSPSVQEPLVRMLTHTAVIKGMTIDESGNYMVTTGAEKKCRVWDLRMYKQVAAYVVPANVGTVSVSQKMVVACAMGNTVELFRDMHIGHCREPYLRHRCSGTVTDLKFVPFEDVLGIGHADGFTSILVPGSGEANVDTLRNNPYETKSQRKEREVKQLLEKISADMICLDPNEIAQVNTDALQDAIEERKKLLWFNQPAIKFTPRNRARKRGGTLGSLKRRGIVEGKKRFERNDKREKARKLFIKPVETAEDGPKHVLDRFKTKRK